MACLTKINNCLIRPAKICCTFVGTTPTKYFHCRHIALTSFLKTNFLNGHKVKDLHTKTKRI